MNKKQLINKLELLREIKPNEDFTKKSRLIIVQTPFTPTISEKINLESATRELRKYSIRDLFSNSFRSVLMFSATVAVLAGIYFATTQLSPLFLPGLNQKGILAEADMVNATINLQLSHVSKFEQNAKESTAALKEVTTNTPSHLNSAIIQDEQSEIGSAFTADPQSQNNKDINDILNTLSQ